MDDKITIQNAIKELRGEEFSSKIDSWTNPNTYLNDGPTNLKIETMEFDSTPNSTYAGKLVTQDTYEYAVKNLNLDLNNNNQQTHRIENAVGKLKNQTSGVIEAANETLNKQFSAAHIATNPNTSSSYSASNVGNTTVGQSNNSTYYSASNTSTARSNNSTGATVSQNINSSYYSTSNTSTARSNNSASTTISQNNNSTVSSNSAYYSQNKSTSNNSSNNNYTVSNSNNSYFKGNSVSGSNATTGASNVNTANYNNSVGDTQSIGDTGNINKEDIDFSKIASNKYDVQNGNFYNENAIHKQYWGDNGNLTYKVVDDNTALIYEDGVAMGYTDLNSINSNNKNS